ncbi:hypothetical protein KJ815_08365, partial [bacterium]|nr:hypothetical protein [bacterium]
WAAYLAEEGSNGYNAWYDTQGSAVKAAGSVLEGAVDLTGELGTVPGEVWLCCGRYQTADGGILAAQAPAAVAPGGHIEASEWVRLVLQPDSLTISVVGPTTIELRWSAVVGATEYAVFRADSLSGSFVEVGRVSSLSFQDSPASASGKYQVRACY